MKLSVVAGGTVLIAAAVGLGGPYWLGIQAEKSYQGALQEASLEYGVNAKDAVYHRGWFSSTARIIVHVPADKARAKSYAVSLVSKIHHGPVVFGVGNKPVFAYSVVVTTLTLPRELDQSLHYYFKDRAPLQATSVIGFDGGMKTHLSSPAYRGPSQDGEVDITWGGLDGDINATLTDHGGDYTAHITVPGLSITGDDGNLDIQTVDFTSQGHRQPNGLWFGNAAATLTKLDADIPAPEAGDNHFSLTGFSLSDNVAPKDHLLSATIRARLVTLTVAGQRFGPGQYDMELRNLSEEGANKYRDILRDVRTLRTQGVDPREILARMGDRLTALAREILAHSPQIEISRVSLGTEQGEIAGRLLVTFDGSSPFNLQNIPVLISRVHGEADADVPEILFKSYLVANTRRQLTSMLQAKGQDMPDEVTLMTTARTSAENEIKLLMDRGLIVSQGGKYSANLRFDRNQLTINGRPMAPNHGL
jgi:uncharacterized protein YdgA (DUF945 family)